MPEQQYRHGSFDSPEVEVEELLGFVMEVLPELVL
jgi:hypothetical protein